MRVCFGAQVVEYDLGLGDKDVGGVVAEGADVEDQGGEFSLPFPVLEAMRVNKKGRGARKLLLLTIVPHVM